MKSKIHECQNENKSNIIHALFSSSLALIALLIMGLFLTSCGEAATDAAALTQQAKPQATLVSLSHPSVDVINNHTPSSRTLVEHGVAMALAGIYTDSMATEEPETLTSANGISILKAVACTGIENREPVDAGTSFAKEVGKVWVYSKVKMPKGTSGTIKHVYKLNGKAISTVELKVHGPAFRTRSYKTITEKLTGNYTVDVVADSGEVLETISFKVD